jgi:hypothetical protein
VRSKLLVVVAVAAAALVAAPAAPANGGLTLHGGATAKAGHVELVSNLADTATANDASWIDLRVPSKLTFAGIRSLATQLDVTDDGCGCGSPRFQIDVGGKSVFVYLGPAPTFTGCSLGTWLSSGNLVGTSDPCRLDTSQPAGEPAPSVAAAR